MVTGNYFVFVTVTVLAPVFQNVLEICSSGMSDIVARIGGKRSSSRCSMYQPLWSTSLEYRQYTYVVDVAVP